jgi:hypothetical protein
LPDLPGIEEYDDNTKSDKGEKVPFKPNVTNDDAINSAHDQFEKSYHDETETCDNHIDKDNDGSDMHSVSQVKKPKRKRRRELDSDS